MKIKDSVLDLLILLKEEEESDLACCKIASGGCISPDGDDWSWKKERIIDLEFAIRCVTSYQQGITNEI